MDFGIKGRVAFVSGGSQGIARETAYMLADEGCKVAIVARTQAPIDKAVAEIRARGGIAEGFSFDLSTAEGCRAAVAAVTEKFGAPDIAIVNVQGNIAGHFDEVTDDDFRFSFEVYTMCIAYLARAVLPSMKEKGWGRIIAIGSGVGKEQAGSLRHILAHATRPGAVGLAKSISNEVARFGITVNTVAPGWIGTENMYHYMESKVGVTPDKVDAWLGDDIPARRIGTPTECASLIAYLSSQQAAYLTGEYIVVDGGVQKSVT